jgi:nucleoid-associated protein YgaU
MRTEAKVGVLLGVVLAAAAIVYFANIADNSSDELADYEPPTTDTPSKIVEAEQIPEPEPGMEAEPKQEPATEPEQDSATEPKQEPATEPEQDSATEPKQEPATEPKQELALKPAPVPDFTPDLALDPELVPQAEPMDTGLRHYTVKKGDTLHKISKNVYGEGKHWNVIYQANRNVISNPNALQLGWILKLPRPEELAE